MVNHQSPNSGIGALDDDQSPKLLWELLKSLVQLQFPSTIGIALPFD